MKRAWIAILVAFVALAGVIGWQVGKPSDEPVYKGRTLTSWLKAELTGRVEHSEVAEAVRQAGTNAVPTLMRLLRAKDSAFKVKVMKFLRHQHLFKVEYVEDEALKTSAFGALMDLGPDAQSAVPALIEMVNQNTSPESRAIALNALAVMDPQASAAIPALLRWGYGTETNQELREAAGEVLSSVDHVMYVRLWRLTAEAESLRNESLEQSFSNVITNERQFSYSNGEGAAENIHEILAAPRAVKVIQTVESMKPAEREQACRRLFAQAFAEHTNRPIHSTQGAVCVAMFAAADLGLRSLLAEEFRELERFRDNWVTNHPGIDSFARLWSHDLPDRGFQLNVLRLVASHDPKLNSMVTKAVEGELKTRGVRTFQICVPDGEIAWYSQLNGGGREAKISRGLRTYEFFEWGYLKYHQDEQEALVQKVKRIVYPTEAR